MEMKRSVVNSPSLAPRQDLFTQIATTNPNRFNLETIGGNIIATNADFATPML